MSRSFVLSPTGRLTGRLLVSVVAVSTIAGAASAEGATKPERSLAAARAVSVRTQSCPPRNPANGLVGRTAKKESLLSEWAAKVTDELHLDTDPNYVILGLNYRRNGVDIYYAGPLPPAVAGLRRAAARDGVPLLHVPVRFGTVALDRATEALESRLTAAGIASDETEEGTPCGGIAAGLTIRVRRPSPALTARVEAIAARTIPNIPVVVAKSDGPVIAAVGSVRSTPTSTTTSDSAPSVSPLAGRDLWWLSPRDVGR